MIPFTEAGICYSFLICGHVICLTTIEQILDKVKSSYFFQNHSRVFRSPDCSVTILIFIQKNSFCAHWLQQKWVSFQVSLSKSIVIILALMWLNKDLCHVVVFTAANMSVCASSHWLVWMEMECGVVFFFKSTNVLWSNYCQWVNLPTDFGRKRNLL